MLTAYKKLCPVTEYLERAECAAFLSVQPLPDLFVLAECHILGSITLSCRECAVFGALLMYDLANAIPLLPVSIQGALQGARTLFSITLS